MQRPPAGDEEIGAAAHPDEILEAFDQERAVGGRNCKPSGPAAARQDGVDFVFQPVELQRHRPGLLDELELAFDVAVQAHEEQAGIGRRRIAAPGRRETTPHAKDAMPVDDGELFHRARHLALARVAAPYVRTERAALALRIFGSTDSHS